MATLPTDSDTTSATSDTAGTSETTDIKAHNLQPADAKPAAPAAAPPTAHRSRLDGQLQYRLAHMMVHTPKLRERFVDELLGAHVPHDRDAVADLMKLAFRKLQGTEGKVRDRTEVLAPLNDALDSEVGFFVAPFAPIVGPGLLLQNQLRPDSDRDTLMLAIAKGTKDERISEEARTLLLQGIMEAVHFEDVQATWSKPSIPPADPARPVSWEAALAAPLSDAAKAQFTAFARLAGAQGEQITEALNSHGQGAAANAGHSAAGGAPVQPNSGGGPAGGSVIAGEGGGGRGEPTETDTTRETGTYARSSAATTDDTSSEPGGTSLSGPANHARQPAKPAAVYKGPLCRPASADSTPLFAGEGAKAPNTIFAELLAKGEGEKSRIAQLRERVFGRAEVDPEVLMGGRDKPWNHSGDLTASIGWKWDLRWEGKTFGMKLANALESLVPDGYVNYEAGQMSSERKKALQFNAAMQTLLADAAFALGKSVDETFKGMMAYVAQQPDAVDPVALEHLTMAASTMIIGTSALMGKEQAVSDANAPVSTHARVTRYLAAIEPLFDKPVHRGSALLAVHALEVGLCHWHSRSRERALQDAYSQLSQRVNRKKVELSASEQAEINATHPEQNAARDRATEEKKAALRAELKDALFALHRARGEPVVDGSPAPASHSLEFDEIQGDATQDKRLDTVKGHTRGFDNRDMANYLVSMSARARERGKAQDWFPLVTRLLNEKTLAEQRALVPAVLHAVDYAQALSSSRPDLDLVRTVANHVRRSNELRTQLANDAGIRELTNNPGSKVGVAYAKALAVAPPPVIPRPAAQPAPAGQPLSAAERAAVDRFNEAALDLGGLEL
mgnify:CR=1 FL=1